MTDGFFNGRFAEVFINFGVAVFHVSGFHGIVPLALLYEPMNGLETCSSRHREAHI
jgi:hypothetical protein